MRGDRKVLGYRDVCGPDDSSDSLVPNGIRLVGSRTACALRPDTPPFRFPPPISGQPLMQCDLLDALNDRGRPEPALLRRWVAQLVSTPPIPSAARRLFPRSRDATLT